MNNTRELVWTGVAHPSREQADTIVANILYEMRPIARERFSGYTVMRFACSRGQFAVIMGDNRVIGCGIISSTKKAAATNLDETRVVLRELGISGNPSVHAMYAGPAPVD